jgi:hypothetical protein
MTKQVNYTTFLVHLNRWNWPSIEHRLKEIAYHCGPFTYKVHYVNLPTGLKETELDKEYINRYWDIL